MNKKGFTLIEVIVSVVLVSIVLVSLLASLIQLRQTYSIIHEDSDIIVYSSSISRVINNDLSRNNGIRYSTCSADGQECDIILGNDNKRNLKIIKNCYVNGILSSCNQENNNKEEIVRTTLKYTDNTTRNEKLVYIRTLELRKYNKNGTITAKGYNFADMSTTTYEHDSDASRAKIDQYTTITIRLNNELNEDISKYDIVLFAAGRYDYSHLAGKTYTLELNADGAEEVGQTRIDEIFGVGYFLTEDNHSVKKRISKISIPSNGDKAFLGYYYTPANSDQKIQVIDSQGLVVTSSRFFREDIDYNLNKDETKPIIIAMWGECTNGYEIRNRRCVPKQYKVTLGSECGPLTEPSYMATYMSKVPDTSIPYKEGYQFIRFYNGINTYNDEEGKGKFIYSLTTESNATAECIECPNKAHVTKWARNNKCEILECAKGYTLKGEVPNQRCEGNTYTATFNKNGATSIGATQKTCTVTNDAGNCTITDIPTITRNGFNKKGWNTNKDATEGLPSLTIEENTTYYAITNKDVEIKFNKNGNGGSDTTRTCTIQNRATNCSITSPGITPASGFRPIGWSTASGTHTSSWDVNTSQTVTDSDEYFAQSSKAKITYPVSYSKGDYVSSIGSTSGSCDVPAVYNGAAQGTSCTVTLPSITPTSGSTSAGWNTLKGATSGTQAGSSYSLNSNSILLYANAIPKPATPTISNSNNNKWVGSNYNIAISTSTAAKYIGKWYYKYGNNSYAELTAGANTNSFNSNRSVDSGKKINSTFYVIACNKNASSSSDSANCSSSASTVVKIDKEPPIYKFGSNTAVNNCIEGKSFSSSSNTYRTSASFENGNRRLICNYVTNYGYLFRFDIDVSCDDNNGSGCSTADADKLRIVAHNGSAAQCGSYPNTWKTASACDYGIGGNAPTYHHTYAKIKDKVGNMSQVYEWWAKNTWR